MPDYNGLKVAIEANNKGHNFLKGVVKWQDFQFRKASPSGEHLPAGREPEIAALSQAIVSGLNANAASDSN